MMDRLMGVLTLKAPVYKAIAEDTSATTTAGIITVVMGVLGGVLGAMALSLAGSSLPPEQVAAMGSPVKIIVSTILNTIIGWLVGSWVLAFVAKMFGGKTDFGEMLRVFGFAQIFQVLNIVPCLGTLLAFFGSIAAAVLGIREAAGFDTVKAILVGIVGFIALFLVSIVIGMILAPLGL